MRPKTDNQRRVVELVATLTPLTPEQESEALALGGRVYIGRTTAWCSGCGHTREAKLWGRRRAKCPACGRTEDVIRSPRKSHAHEKYYYAVAEVCEEYQVVRSWLVDREIWRDGRTRLNKMAEVFQHWVRPDGVDTIIARSVRPMSYYVDMWDVHSELSVKQDHVRYHPGVYLAAKQRLIPTLRRNGLKRLVDRVDIAEEVKTALTDPFAEMLLKAGRTAEFVEQSSMYHKFSETEKVALRIAVRHRYRIRDLGMWRDYVAQLVELEKDIHSPHYVCPEDLKAEHARLTRKIECRREAERRRVEREKMEKDAEAQATYAQRCGRFFGIVLTDGDLTVEPLRSIEEFIEEGEAMHHCVMTNKYWAKEDCLIMSARIGGQRAATLEIRLSEGRIVQCRGAHNKTPEQYSRITELVNGAMRRIQNCG